MSIRQISPSEAHGTLCFYKELQVTKRGVDIGLVLSVMGTIGAVIAACYLHGALHPAIAFQATLTGAICLGVITVSLIVTQHIFTSRLKGARVQLNKFWLNLLPLSEKAMQELAQYPSLILSNLMYFTPAEIAYLKEENEEITFQASFSIDEILAKGPRGLAACLQELQSFFGECKPQEDSTPSVFSYVNQLEEVLSVSKLTELRTYVSSFNPYADSHRPISDYTIL